uniref:Anaphylatoxin-like domain-containing protein n=1 Tax=Oncorhynchus tshawytscha TaxID=74940 RepID=A0AAZ3QKT8_ONCTS
MCVCLFVFVCVFSFVCVRVCVFICLCSCVCVCVFLFVFCVFVCSCLCVFVCSCLITAPNIVHLGVEETVTVQLQGAIKPTQITLYFLYQTDNNKVLSGKKHVTLNEANGYQEVVKMSVVPSLYEEAIKNIGKTKTIVPYIQLAAESNDFFKKKKTILLSTKKGYVFIQTDKPIYNPGENVNFRVFTLDNYLLPVEESINVKIFNSKGLLVYNQALHSSKLLQRNIMIPDVETAGHWKILAAFTKHPMSNSSVEFEVREYVLPTFEVTITALKPYYLVTEESFQFSVSVRYTYGKGVNGIAYVRFGLIDIEGNRIHLPGLENKTSIQDGVASITLPTEDLRGKAGKQNIQHMEGYNLYIAVTVLETASGDLEEAESTSVKIVTSPYIIDMSKTKEYFTPGGKFSILATTTHPDGSPAPDLRMRASVSVTSVGGTQESKLGGSGNSKGEAVLTFEVPKLATSMDIKVQDRHRELSINTVVMSSGNSYLSVEIEHVTLEPGGTMTVTLRDITPPGTPRPAYIYYMVLSKGRVVQMNRVQRTELTTFSLPYSLDLVPSFRLVAYYFTQAPEKTTIVADSVWADVKDICKGQILPFKEHKPADLVTVVVRTDQGDKVALAAVDTAVYILNKDNKLTAQKMFAYMNSYDLACSMGGGRNSQSVLQDAGLAFITNWGDTENHLDTEFLSAVNRYPDNMEKRCCQDGARFNSLGLSCESRHAKTTHRSISCRTAFLKCCRDATKLRNNIKKTRKTYSLARSTLSYYIITLVTGAQVIIAPLDFQRTVIKWLMLVMAFPSGFCIAEPKPLVVFQDFFVSLRLPYSVKRNEQLQVKAVVYNYRTDSMEVTVELAWVEGLCSAGGDRGDKEVVTVPGKSAVPVYFTVVPLVIGNIPIQVEAYTKTARDQIKKHLKVTSIELKIPPPPSAVPGLESDAYISVKGGVMGESVENCLNLDGVDRLISLPMGCAEQTMVTMSPAIHAMRYLDTTGQWIDLKAERRDEAQAMIQAGYGRILTFKKTDGSYGAFLATPSSVWLTAFIAKELSQCRDVITVEDSYIQQSISYLVSKQLASGAFTDPNPLYDRTMQGGVGGFEGEVSLTAFVLIAMHHAVPLYSEGQDSEVVIHHSSHGLNLNITASDALRLSGEKRANRVPQAKAISVETTAYALLQTVAEEDVTYATRIARWLTEQRQYGGGFRSTQVGTLGQAISRQTGRYCRTKTTDDGPELDDYYNYESEGDGNPSDEPMSRVEWFDLRTRRKRHAPQEDEEREKSLVYTVCTSCSRQCRPLLPLTLYCRYVLQITEEPQCVAFRAKQISPMGLVQPAAAVVYDYYNPERRCTVFYSAPQKSNMISKICQDNVCSCAEGDCPKKRVTYSKQMEKETRRTFACFSPVANYVYVVKIVNSSDDGVFKHYTTILTKILQTGEYVMQTGAVRDMIKRKACDEFDMKTDSNYLIMGRDGTISHTTDHSGK